MTAAMRKNVNAFDDIATNITSMTAEISALQMFVKEKQKTFFGMSLQALTSMNEEYKSFEGLMLETLRKADIVHLRKASRNMCAVLISMIQNQSLFKKSRRCLDFYVLLDMSNLLFPNNSLLKEFEIAEANYLKNVAECASPARESTTPNYFYTDNNHLNKKTSVTTTNPNPVSVHLKNNPAAILQSLHERCNAIPTLFMSLYTSFSTEESEMPARLELLSSIRLQKAACFELLLQFLFLTKSLPALVTFVNTYNISYEKVEEISNQVEERRDDCLKMDLTVSKTRTCAETDEHGRDEASDEPIAGVFTASGASNLLSEFEDDVLSTCSDSGFIHIPHDHIHET